MAVAQMTCVHKWQIDRKNVGTCSVCGEVRQFPLEKGQDPVLLKEGGPRYPKHRRKSATRINNTKRHAYYEEHKQAIIADMLSVGPRVTRQRWGIPNGSIIYLAKRWLTEDQRAPVLAAGTEPGSPGQPRPAIAGDGRLPHFPEFSGTWDPSVQLKWLEVYQNLHIKEKNNEH